MSFCYIIGLMYATAYCCWIEGFEFPLATTQLKNIRKEEWPKIILKEYVGHTPSQVLGGIITGLVVGYCVCCFL